MKMPFPGMDPYLEHPILWSGVHARLMVALANQLRSVLRPRYLASVEERVVIEQSEEQSIPDVSIKQIRDTGSLLTAPGTATDTPLVLEARGLELREHYIDILDRYQNQKVVTTIEVVSPANKAAGPGRRAYRRKQRETLASECHLVEVDFLRRGRHVLCIPRHLARTAPPHDYLVCVNRSPDRARYEVYPRALRDRLPRVAVPLVAPDPDATLDFQAALEQVYEEGDYMLRVRYDEPCLPRLTAADQEWANQCWAAYQEAHRDLFPKAPASGNANGAAAATPVV